MGRAARVSVPWPNTAEPVFRDLLHVLFFRLVVFAPMFAAAAAVIFVIKIVHGAMLIRGERGRLQRAAPIGTESACVSSVSKERTQISLILIAMPFLGVAALILKKTKFHRSRLFMVDAILVRLLQLRYAHYFDKKLLTLSFLRNMPICLVKLVITITVKASPCLNAHILALIFPRKRR